MATHIFRLSLVASVLRYSAAADPAETSVYVPFIDAQPISADIIGIDEALGRTTYALHQGAKTGTWADQQDNMPGTATLIEGSDFASLAYNVADPKFGTMTFGGACSIQGGSAVCVEAQEGGFEGATTFTETESVVPFGLQIAPTQNGFPANSDAFSSSGSGAGPRETSGGVRSGSTASSIAPASTQSSSCARISPSAVENVGALLAFSLLCYAVTFANY
ncbi:hypothetical protein R3P38DRAFT_2904913 [Favolaschia claudopus]|uniref:Uncharacterized protein n=1 Tax=Favolaschia claudopus TaxID=2862362 RepID=A0AAW0CGR2_9AGAR